nr:unnamed protein product [Callosobruchus analis]
MDVELEKRNYYKKLINDFSNRILNENDNVPLSEEAVYYPSVAEDSPPGTEVLQIKATDRDKDPNQEITYKITSGNPEGFFAINSTTGELSIFSFHFHYPYITWI